MPNSVKEEKNMLSPMVEVDLSALGTDASVLSVQEYASLGHLNVRGASGNAKFMQAVKKVLGTDLPTQANTFIDAGKNTILWLGPNEWLLLTPPANALGLESKLRTALSGVFSSVNDVSGGSTVLELTGSKAQALLLKGCPLDLHRSVFKTGECAQSVLGKTNIVLWQVGDAPVYRLIVRRSFADYLGRWLLNAAREFTPLDG